MLDYLDAWSEERGVAPRLTGAAAPVAGDRFMLRRVFSNLLTNAIRHTPRGGEILVSLEGRVEEIRVQVANPGDFIPEEHLPRLFDRFYRPNPSRQRQGEGAGLGLAIVKSIIDAHRGRIAVTSDGQGTRFRITLPTGESV